MTDGPPQPPGWYPDPWNPQAHRYWDGWQWTPETAAEPPARPTDRVARLAASAGAVGGPQAACRSLLTLGDLAMDEGDVQEAARAYAAAVDTGPHDLQPRARMMLGLAQLRLGDSAGGQQRLRDAMATGGPDVVSVAGDTLGRCLEVEGDRAGAAWAYESAHRAGSPDAAEALRQLHAQPWGAAPSQPHSGPFITSAAEVDRFRLGPYSAVLLGNVKADGSVGYEHVLAVSHGDRQEFLITAETGPNHDSCFLCVFDGGRHHNLGAEENWRDRDTFVRAALQLAAGQLSVTDPPVRVG